MKNALADNIHTGFATVVFLALLAVYAILSVTSHPGAAGKLDALLLLSAGGVLGTAGTRIGGVSNGGDTQ